MSHGARRQSSGTSLRKMSANAKIPAGTLYDPAFEHDACGVGFVADTQGRAGAHILPLALSALGRMAHRGAVDADGKTGDGAGVTTQIPYAVFDPELERLGIHLASPGDLAVGLLFLPTCPDRRRNCKKVVAETLARQGRIDSLGLERGGPRRRLVGLRRFRRRTPRARLRSTRSCRSTRHSRR